MIHHVFPFRFRICPLFCAGFLSMVALFWLVCLCSCSRPAAGAADPSTPVSITDGKVLSQYVVATSMPRGVAASQTSYTEVDSTKLAVYYQHFLWAFGQLSGQNAPHWDPTLNCTAFAALYADLAKCEYYLRQFQPGVAGLGVEPAVGTVWYVKDGAAKAGHAIVEVLTEKGRLFVEPQSGAIVTLSATELASAWQVQF